MEEENQNQSKVPNTSFEGQLSKIGNNALKELGRKHCVACILAIRIWFCWKLGAVRLLAPNRSETI